jgi:aryl sulfotransferase
VSLAEMRSESERLDPGLVNSFKGGATTFFFKGVNWRWKDVLSAGELELYERKVSQILAPEAREWIEYGRLARR